MANGGGIVDGAKSAVGANGEMATQNVRCRYGARHHIARGAPRPPTRHPSKVLRTETVLAPTRGLR